MITIAQCVEEIITTTPFLQDLLMDDLINVSALARKIQPQVMEQLWKEDVSIAAIIMALKRLQSETKQLPIRKIDLSTLGDITVRSKLTLFIYENSAQLITMQKKLLDFVSKAPDRFMNFSQGLLETSIIVSTEAVPLVKKWLTSLHAPKPIYRADQLACITIRIPHQSTFIPGYFYNVLRPLALAGINIVDITSVNREITFIFADTDIDRAFSTLKALSNKTKPLK